MIVLAPDDSGLTRIGWQRRGAHRRADRVLGLTDRSTEGRIRDHRNQRIGRRGPCLRMNAGRRSRALPRVVRATAASVLALVATLLGVSMAAARLTVASVGRCWTADLALSVNGRDSGSAGSYYFHIDFRNDSRQTCRISGYPGVSAVDTHGRRIGAPAGREVTGHVAAVTLRPGRHTSAILHATDVGSLPASSCRPTTPVALRVYPPDDRASKLVPFHYPVCAATGSMRVRTVKTEAGF